MTMIACTINRVAPIVIADILISQNDKPDSFNIPVLHEDVLQYLSDSKAHPISLDQKIYILKDNVCIAFAGTVYYFKEFLEDISFFCRVSENITMQGIENFLNHYSSEDIWSNFSFLILVVEREGDAMVIKRLNHGNWLHSESKIYGEIFATGSGANDFIIEANEDITAYTNYNQNDIYYVMQLNIILIVKLLAKERLTLKTIRKHWGAGFELVYYSGGKFQKLDNVTYIINYGMFDNEGNIREVPVPSIIMNYKYYGETLCITVIMPNHGRTSETSKEYIITSNNFSMRRFFIRPINDDSTISVEKTINDFSFKSERNAMAYLIELGDTHFVPTSFTLAPELNVDFDHSKDELTITMYKEFNDKMVDMAKAVFQNISKES